MPISPMPPSAMKTSSSPARRLPRAFAISRGSSRQRRAPSVTSPKVSLRCRPCASRMSKRAAVVEADEACRRCARVPCRPSGSRPTAPPRAEPGRAHARRSRRRRPTTSSQRCMASARKPSIASGATVDAMRGEVRRGARRVRRVRRQIDADADHDDDLRARRPRIWLSGRMPAHLASPIKTSFGHFSRKPAIRRAAPPPRSPRPPPRRRRSESWCTTDWRAGEPLQQAGVEIAGLGRPCAARAAAPLRLAPRHDPQRPGSPAARARTPPCWSSRLRRE